LIHLNENYYTIKAITGHYSVASVLDYRVPITIHIASLSFIASGEKQIISVIAITSKPGNRGPKVPNPKTRDRVPASPI